VASVQGNGGARALLQRDVERLVQYFSRYCRVPEPAQLCRQLWHDAQRAVAR
jgi:hypothetical protein